MVLTRAQVRHWLDRFDAVAHADREALKRTGPRPEWSVAVALSLIEAARAVQRDLLARSERDDDETARRAWARLRARLRS